jgi:5-methyltetrahydrofolate--homocysteine methyltransferase
MESLEIINQFKNSIVEMDLEKAKKLCREALDQGILPFKIINDGIAEALMTVGEKFEAEEYFLPELIMAGETMKQVMNILEPEIKGSREKKEVGKVVIGTGKGDIHDIGKNIVKTFLEAEGFEVIDLGVDVSPEKFVEAVRTENPNILAMSTLVSGTMLELKDVMKALKEANLRNQVKVIIGGAPINQEFVDSIGGDAYAQNAINGVNICKRWMEE